MKQQLISLALMLLVIWGLSYWAIAAKAYLGLPSDKGGREKVPCVVISTRADEAIDLHSASQRTEQSRLFEQVRRTQQTTAMIRVNFH